MPPTFNLGDSVWGIHGDPKTVINGTGIRAIGPGTVSAIITRAAGVFTYFVTRQGKEIRQEWAEADLFPDETAAQAEADARQNAFLDSFRRV
jgi:two-component SAPR family response regulator